MRCGWERRGRNACKVPGVRRGGGRQALRGKPQKAAGAPQWQRRSRPEHRPQTTVHAEAPPPPAASRRRRRRHSGPRCGALRRAAARSAAASPPPGPAGAALRAPGGQGQQQRAHLLIGSARVEAGDARVQQLHLQRLPKVQQLRGDRLRPCSQACSVRGRRHRVLLGAGTRISDPGPQACMAGCPGAAPACWERGWCGRSAGAAACGCPRAIWDAAVPIGSPASPLRAASPCCGMLCSQNARLAASPALDRPCSGTYKFCACSSARWESASGAHLRSGERQLAQRPPGPPSGPASRRAAALAGAGIGSRA